MYQPNGKKNTHYTQTPNKFFDSRSHIIYIGAQPQRDAFYLFIAVKSGWFWSVFIWITQWLCQCMKEWKDLDWLGDLENETPKPILLSQHVEMFFHVCRDLSAWVLFVIQALKLVASILKVVLKMVIKSSKPEKFDSISNENDSYHKCINWLDTDITRLDHKPKINWFEERTANAYLC